VSRQSTGSNGSGKVSTFSRLLGRKKIIKRGADVDSYSIYSEDV
jgi:hypothetical protein